MGKTSFILKALEELPRFPQIRLNLLFKGAQTVNGLLFYGRDYFGHDEEAGELLNNIALAFGPLEKMETPVIIFIDEADRHPVSLEAVQKLAGLGGKLKVIYTGSNLENIQTKNAATGRKCCFDLYPITFAEFLKACGKGPELKYLKEYSLASPLFSEHYHQSLTTLFDLYLRLGGMPRILDTFIDKQNTARELPGLIADLAASIEENVKLVLGEKSRLYEYEDVLRKMALLSMETLKFSRLQVQHAGQKEAKKLVNKTVGARVAHKIRLYDSGKDLSKYILFDAGILNYLLNGSDLLRQKIVSLHLALQYENVVGDEIIANLPTRDDLYYWKSERGAQVEFLLKSPRLTAIDVKSAGGNVKSLNSCANYEKEADLLVKIAKERPALDKSHVAKIPNQGLSRKIPLATIPHYLSGRLLELI
ncbi:MAG: ATP-binding protein [Deltaproteobacteria bacterium]|nr:ATP-binding protein [Deltaproteobacteria bacterium]